MSTTETAEIAEPVGDSRRTTREDWLDLALNVLVSEGVGAVKVLNLAQRLNVSRSSFYWFFRSRRDLLDQLLHFWEHKNTASIVERAKRPAQTITEAVLGVFECWVDETIYDPGLDFAVREWARRSPEVRKLVDEADEARVQALAEMFRRHGFDELDAFIRARVLYFMQIGYYALETREPMDLRLSYIDAYLRSFTGRDGTAKELRRFRKLALRLVGEPTSQTETTSA